MGTSRVGRWKLDTEQIERCVRRFGPLSTTQVKTILGLRDHKNMARRIAECQNLRVLRTEQGESVWEYVR